jgi:SIR2-like domain
MGERDEPRENTLRPETWETLVDAVSHKECTPFLGAGVAVPYLPRGAQLAEELAKEFDYPLDDVTNLARVTQYIASRHQPSYAKRRVCERITDAQADADRQLNGRLPQAHVALAWFQLPLYVTTNYDDYLQRAVSAAVKGPPTVEVCRWNDRLALDLPKYSAKAPTAEKPLIFHLHGHVSEQNSVLVTEDDYIDFVVSLTQRREKTDPVIPHYVRRALGNTNLLFIGYSLEDWNFRVLLRHIMRQQNIQLHDRYRSLSIQFASTNLDPEKRRRAEEFLERYLQTTSAIDVYWGDAGTFLCDLQRRVAERPTARAS